MYKVIAFFLTSFLFFSCTKETEFSAGSDKRVTAIIDMAPESALYKFDFKSDENIGDCEDHDVAVINRYENGDLDNQYYVLQILAKDYFKSENNCEGYNSSITDEEQVQHEFSLYLYMNELTSPVKINGSDYVDHPNLVNANVVATYRLLSGENGDTNGGQGISYYGHNFSVEIIDLDLGQNYITGTLSGTLYRGTPVVSVWNFDGVDNFPGLDLYNPYEGDYIDDFDDDGVLDIHLTDSIRIENCVFQKITLIDNS